jgi:integrase
MKKRSHDALAQIARAPATSPRGENGCFHDLPHTFVSLLIQRGAHPKYIQEQVGHSSIQVKMDTHGHLFQSQNREWVNKLDDTYEPKDPVATR